MALCVVDNQRLCDAADVRGEGPEKSMGQSGSKLRWLPYRSMESVQECSDHVKTLFSNRVSSLVAIDERSYYWEI